MKEDIFVGGQERAARDLLERIRPWMRRSHPVFTPENCALLVLDMQDYFLHPDSHAFIPGAPSTVPVIRRLASAFLSKNKKVVFTRHINTEADAGMMGE
ncbi:MAG TPA: isochorismatase family protein, partial [Candidatus Krumholzibacterium sp.]|nr:isochorismatase family protein [Candidatus Krumholzibacterium sp.]